MPAPRDPWAYPADYFDIFLLAEKKIVELPAHSYRSAVNLRNHLYAFRRALARESHPLSFSAKPLMLKIIATETGYIIRIVHKTRRGTIRYAARNR